MTNACSYLSPVKSSPDPQSEDEPPLHLPYLITALVGAHRAQRSLVGLQVRWLERFLAAWETESGNPDRVSCSETFDDLSPPLAFCPRLLWDTSNVGIAPDPFRGPHLPLPPVSPTNMGVAMPRDGRNEMTTITCLEFSRHVSSLVHFANFLYPLFTLRGPGRQGNEDQSLSPSQTSAIARVNSFLSSRWVSPSACFLLTISVHAQRGLQYFVCVCECVSVCFSPAILALRATGQPMSDTNNLRATKALK